MMESSVSTCPVPSEQQPINEYKDLSESWFFRWGTIGLKDYLIKLAWTWGLSWAISGPVAAASFSPAKQPMPFAFWGAAGASVFLTLVLLRLYLGWTYVRDRLSSPTVFYEESGWYDGQTWTKTPDVLTKDQLIVTYQIQPILQRLHRTFFALGVGLLAGALVWSSL